MSAFEIAALALLLIVALKKPGGYDSTRIDASIATLREAVAAIEANQQDELRLLVELEAHAGAISRAIEDHLNPPPPRRPRGI